MEKGFSQDLVSFSQKDGTISIFEMRLFWFAFWY